MNRKDKNYHQYIAILKEELVPAGGCTEPIAIAYTAAVARKILGKMPEHMEVYASGNLIKNAKSVYIPNGGDLRGVDAAAVLGVIGGNPDRELEVLLDMPPDKVEETRLLLEKNFCKVSVLENSEALHLVVCLYVEGEKTEVELKNAHLHIVRIEKDGKLLFCSKDDEGNEDGFTDHDCLSVEKIYDFANTCCLEDISEVLEKQIACNRKIAEEGLKNSWGINVGKLYYKNGRFLQAYAAAASDARMSGCNMPVVIVSGSGNQGATASLPVILFAEEKGIGHERLLRALVLSNLITIHLKSGIGRLSAYCGAVCAATGSGCAMTYLDGGSLEQIEQTITNSIGTSSGMVCDGAKPSCAAKIATSLEGAIMAYELAMRHQAFLPGEGIIMDSVEKTIGAVGCMASEGMYETDRVILDLMTK